MNTHDPQKAIEDLRNNLAAHDRPIYFLFGAGTSSSINIASAPVPGKKREFVPLIPSIIPLTKICKESASTLGLNYKKAWEILEKQCEECGKGNNIENILSILRSKIEAIGLADKLIGLDKKGLETLEGNIRASIVKEVRPDDAKIPQYIPHYLFASWLKKAARVQPIEIFTTNYDMLIEKSLEFEQIPYFDGFVGSCEPFFYGNSIEDDDYMPSKKWAKLWKIHGSVNWMIKKIDNNNVVVRSNSTDAGEMILPSQRKYDESRKQPYTALLDRLSKVLNKDHSLLITCGYSFGDQHINSVIISALENKHTTHVISLQYQHINAKDDLVRLAVKRRNLTVLGANSAVIGGKYSVWKLSRAVDDKTCNFMDLAFDSNAAIDNDEEAMRGIMRLGDFNSFCEFLMTMERKTGDIL